MVGTVVAVRDVSELRGITRQMSYQASHDALTGLVNRREFERRLEEALEASNVSSARHVMCYLDLDRFKLVNDSCGHMAGDTMLREVRTALSLGPSGDWKVPIVKTVASEGTGIGELRDAIEAHRSHVEETGTLEERRARNLRSEVLGLAAARMRRELEQRIAEDPSVATLLDDVVSRRTDPATAAAELLAHGREGGGDG